MAKRVLVNVDKVNELGNEVEQLLQEMQACYDSILKNKQLICENWQSDAALQYVTNIDKQNKNINKLKDSIKNDKEYTLKTSAQIREIDRNFAKQFENNKA